MLHWSLAQHSQLWGSAESDFLFEWVKGAKLAWAAGNVHDELHWLPKEKVSFEEFFGFAGAGIDAMYRSRSEGKRWLEQTPRYVFLYDSLRHMFPGAPVHTRCTRRPPSDRFHAAEAWLALRTLPA